MLFRSVQFLKYDPRPSLQTIQSKNLRFFIDRDIFELDVGSASKLWDDPAVLKILKKQLPDGSWPDKNAKKHVDAHTNYRLVETYRNLRVLIEVFGMDRTHSAVENAVEYIFSTQTDEGDFRGIYGRQYSPNYTGGLLELIVMSGYFEDKRVDKAFHWFLKIQQKDGGWTLPMQTWDKKARDWDEYVDKDILTFQPEKPFAHFVTGIVLRAFANHPSFSHHPDAQKAGELITTRFFKEDKYPSYKSAKTWTRYTFPFWWNDLIAVLDALAKMGFSISNAGMKRAAYYYYGEQQSTGLWNFDILQSKSLQDIPLWLNYRLCLILKQIIKKNRE